MTANNREVVEKSQIVWLAVKPHAISKVLMEIAPIIRPDYHLVVSAAAGIPIKTLEKVSQIFNKIMMTVGLCFVWKGVFTLSWEEITAVELLNCSLCFFKGS